jgi:hypothetical protein
MPAILARPTSAMPGIRGPIGSSSSATSSWVSRPTAAQPAVNPASSAQNSWVQRPTSAQPAVNPASGAQNSWVPRPTSAQPAVNPVSGAQNSWVAAPLRPSSAYPVPQPPDLSDRPAVGQHKPAPTSGRDVHRDPSQYRPTDPSDRPTPSDRPNWGDYADFSPQPSPYQGGQPYDDARGQYADGIVSGYADDGHGVWVGDPGGQGYQPPEHPDFGRFKNPQDLLDTANKWRDDHGLSPYTPSGKLLYPNGLPKWKGTVPYKPRPTRPGIPAPNDGYAPSQPWNNGDNYQPSLRDPFAPIPSDVNNPFGSFFGGGNGPELPPNPVTTVTSYRYTVRTKYFDFWAGDSPAAPVPTWRFDQDYGSEKLYIVTT